jgi:hypothetical protein
MIIILLCILMNQGLTLRMLQDKKIQKTKKIYTTLCKIPITVPWKPLSHTSHFFDFSILCSIKVIWVFIISLTKIPYKRHVFITNLSVL